MLFYVLEWNRNDTCRQNCYAGPWELDVALDKARAAVPFGRKERETMRADLLQNRRVDSFGRYGVGVSIYPADHLPGYNAYEDSMARLGYYRY